MGGRRRNTIDGNEAATSVAYRASEVVAVYPITPSSPMGELADEWSAQGRKNLWEAVPEVIQLQSEGGAAGAVHGALQAGALATTFTSSQGLLLMIPNMYRIAGELTSFCMHVAARTLATHALSIFGDHSDVMACRGTGFALLCSGSVQEAHDFACLAHAATLRSRVPFLHFFDGFRTSHEMAKIEELTDDELRSLIDQAAVGRHRARGLTPDRPVLRGTAQNPDAFFQAREAINPFYAALPGIVRGEMDRFAALTGRRYRLVDYAGHPEAERVLVIMGSGAETAHETAEYLAARGEKVGVLKVRLFRPFPGEDFVAALPPTVRSIAVLDRTKEPGAPGEPLYLDVVAALRQAADSGRSPLAFAPRLIGGRYGLGSKEFDPAMAKAVFDELGRERPKTPFTVGITDDVMHLSLAVDRDFDIEPAERVRAVFYGLGSDGTVGANRNSIRIIGEGTDHGAQGYFVYDSKKAGALTISHLRFGAEPIRSPYLIRRARFVACHQFRFLDKYDLLDVAEPGAIFLLNAPYGPKEVWDHLPLEVQQAIVDKRLRLHVIDAEAVAGRLGMRGRINVIMQACFFALSEVLPREEALSRVKAAIASEYGHRGEEVVRRNCEAVDAAPNCLSEVPVPESVTATRSRPPMVAEAAPEFVRRVTAVLMAGKGDLLPVSAFPVDGTWPLGTSRYEKRNIALDIPVWEPEICIQCNKCALHCPHAVIRARVYPGQWLAGAPSGFKSMEYRGREFHGWKYTIQVAPEDCTGCSLCVEICPAKDRSNPRRKALRMEPQEPLRGQERANWSFFSALPEPDRTAVRLDVKGTQFLTPCFEFSGACAGCGETPYLMLLTQLFGDRLLIANATGCSSIYGANLPATPYAARPDGRGPAWSNSLFEDNAEFGLGLRLAVDSHERQARELVRLLAPHLGESEAMALLEADQSSEAGIAAQRARVAALKARLAARFSGDSDDAAGRLPGLADFLVRKDVWIVGGDGWAYDIGFGGLDHVLSLGRRVRVLVLDTEVYSNTGGQQSKATPAGAAAKFASLGKEVPKKDLGLMVMGYGSVYVASVAMGAKDSQTVQAFLEAASFPGPALLIASSPCVAHGYDLAKSPEQERLAVETGVWPLYRFDPRRAAAGLPPLQLDSPAPKGMVRDYMLNQTRFRMVERQDPIRFRRLVAEAQRQTTSRLALYRRLASPAGAPEEANASVSGPFPQGSTARQV